VPRLHDVRHSHASWLIARRAPLPAIQGRLGHESITTTVDRYGHLLDALDDEILAAVEWAMDPKAPLPAFLQETGLSGLGSYFEDDGWENDSSDASSDTENEGVVYAVSVAGRDMLFADLNHAQLVVDQWTDDRVAEIAQQRQQGGDDGHGRARVALGPEERLASADDTKVWTRLPARQYVYSAMASYHPDGSLAYEPPPVSGRWVWEFEVGLFTVQPAQHRRELRPHGGVEVQARGTFRAAVERCFEQLCVEGASTV
jgi:hypothetical protein